MEIVRLRGVRRWAAIVFLALEVVTNATPARASDPTEDELIHKGVERRRHQDDDAALELFQKAYALHKSPIAAAQMGLAEMALGRWPDADEHLTEALAASSDAWVTKNSGTLNKALAAVRQHVGRLQVLGGPKGAEVVIAGEVRGTLPMTSPIPVRAGDCRIDVRAAGFEPTTRTVQIGADELTRETVQLSPVLQAAPPSEPIAAATVGPTVSVSPTPPDLAVDRGRTLRAVGIGLTAGGVAAVGAGVAFGLIARSRGNTDSSAPVFDPSRESSGKELQTLQWVSYGIGGALLVGGVVTYLVGLQRQHSQATVETALLPAVIPGPGGAMAGLVGTL